MQAGVACIPVAEIKGKSFGADDSKVVDKYKDYWQNKVGISIYFLQIFGQISHLLLKFYLKLICNFILQLIISYYITFKIKFPLLPFKLTPFLRNKKRLLQTVFGLQQSCKFCYLVCADFSSFNLISPRCCQSRRRVLRRRCRRRR